MTQRTPDQRASRQVRHLPNNPNTLGNIPRLRFNSRMVDLQVRVVMMRVIVLAAALARAISAKTLTKRKAKEMER